MEAKEVQATLIQLDNYGPWTGTLGSDREYRLQILQAELYSALQEDFAQKDGLVFFNRFDEMLAITNGISAEEHERIRVALQERFPLSVSMGIGVDENPYRAQLKASKLLQQHGSAQSPTRRGIIASQRTLNLENSHVQIMHFDVDAITKTLTDRESAYETSMYVMALYTELMKRLREQEALAFFAGGDNFIGVANGVPTQEIESVIQGYRQKKINLKCGIGIARTGRKAAELAAMNLDLIRQKKSDKAILSTTDL